MAKTTDTSRMLRSIVSPALGLSLGALAAAGASVGCGTSATSVSAEGVSGERIPPPGTMAPITTTTPTTATSTTAAAPASGTAEAPSTSGTPATSTSAVASGTGRSTTAILPVGSSVPRIPPPGTVAHPGLVTRPGNIPAPGKVAAPGFAASTPSHVASAERPTRRTRRATDPDLRALRGRGRSLV